MEITSNQKNADNNSRNYANHSAHHILQKSKQHARVKACNKIKTSKNDNHNKFQGGKKMSLPNDLLYSKEHAWAREEGSDVRIGITDFAQDELGDIVFVELPEVGDEIEINEPFGSVESVKTVSELYAPISGTVVEVNEALESNPEYVNESPYDQAWLVVVEPSDDAELDELLSANEYETFVSE